MQTEEALQILSKLKNNKSILQYILVKLKDTKTKMKTLKVAEKNYRYFKALGIRLQQQQWKPKTGISSID
jgi:hypothetical protein